MEDIVPQFPQTVLGFRLLKVQVRMKFPLPRFTFRVGVRVLVLMVKVR